MSDNWFKEIAERCPWHYYTGIARCKAVEDTADKSNYCCKENCATFFMAATIISAYKEDEINPQTTTEG